MLLLLLVLLHFKTLIDLELMRAKRIVHIPMQLHTVKKEVSGQRK